MTDTIKSTDNNRTINNVMRHNYRVLSEVEKQHMSDLKDMGMAFIEKCDSMGTSRELSLAKTKAEESVMWAVKHLTA